MNNEDLYITPQMRVIEVSPRRVTCLSNIEDREIIEGDWE